MDTFVLLKFLHVISALVWLGGGFTMVLQAIILARRPDPAALMGVIGQVAFLGPRLFMPASIATLVTGVATAWVGGFGWSAFIVLGLAGVAVTAVLGAVKLGPISERIVRLVETGDHAAAEVQAHRLLRLARADYAVQFGIVFLMVVKPDWDDVGLLVGVGVVVLLAVLASVTPGLRRLQVA